LKKNPYTLPADAASFIPHRDTMRLIDSLDMVEPDIGKASMTIRRESIFYESHLGLNPVAFVELIAQTAAAHNGYMNLINKKPVRPGFLAAVKDFYINGSAPEGNKVYININRVLDLNQATVLEGNVISENGVEFAAGTLNMWIFDDALPLPSDSGHGIPFDGNPMPYPVRSSDGRDAVSTYVINHIRVQQTDEATLSPDFVGFKGHFPGLPVLPGIVTLQMAVISTEALLKKRIRLHKVDKTKFIQPTLPNQWVNIECRIDHDEKGPFSRVQFFLNHQKIASVILHFEEV
jgi:predicted hotdog family 3-hydroxylacyl-ACP dehydratase